MVGSVFKIPPMHHQKVLNQIVKRGIDTLHNFASHMDMVAPLDNLNGISFRGHKFSCQCWRVMLLAHIHFTFT
jgi:hypothetical protein